MASFDLTKIPNYPSVRVTAERKRKERKGKECLGKTVIRESRETASCCRRARTQSPPEKNASKLISANYISTRNAVITDFLFPTARFSIRTR